MTADRDALRALLADGRCLCSHASTDWEGVAALLDAADERDWLVAGIEALPDAETLRWYATHEALCRHKIFDVLMSLADLRATREQEAGR